MATSKTKPAPPEPNTPADPYATNLPVAPTGGSGQAPQTPENLSDVLRNPNIAALIVRGFLSQIEGNTGGIHAASYPAHEDTDENNRLALLDRPFLRSEIEWKPVKDYKDGNGIVAPYVTARAVMNRLDMVFGKGGWQNSYRAGADGGVVCTLRVRIGGEWITKEDGAENTKVEPVKGGMSGALRRAAVQLGIGRYLYEAPMVRCRLERGRIVGSPSLPAHMTLPEDGGDWANVHQMLTEEEADRIAERAREEEREPSRRAGSSRNERPAPHNQQRRPEVGGRGRERPQSRERQPAPPVTFKKGKWPKYEGLEAWAGFMPDDTKRKENGKVTENDYKEFSKCVQRYGWSKDAVRIMLSDVFGADRFSALVYAEYCGAKEVLMYKDARSYYEEEAEAEAQARRDAREEMEDWDEEEGE